MFISSPPSHVRSEFLTSVDGLVQANHAFFEKKELSPVGRKDLREAALAQGLAALARCHNVLLVQPLRVDSRGDFMIAVDQMTAGVYIVNPANGTRVFGQAFSDLLNGFSPRCGHAPGAVLFPEASWCYMNHFSVEKMLLTAALRYKAEAMGGEKLAPGLEVVTVRGELDLDEEGQERITPVGSVGVLVDHSIPGQWEVHFSDAAVHVGEGALFNPGEYRLRTHFRAEAKELLDDCGVSVTEASGQPRVWVWCAPTEGCEASFSSEGEAIDDALSAAMDQARKIMDIGESQWSKVPLDERLDLVRQSFTADRPFISQR